MRAAMSAAWEALAPAFARPWAFVSLTKPDVTFLVLMTTMAGFYLGSRGPVEYVLLAHTLFGTILVAMGTAALNHYIERDADARMRRTASRPLPQGTLRPVEALLFGVGLVISGVVYLAFLANGLASFLALATCVLYLGVYTPLKTRTTLATAIGAVPGALPPLIGWAAAHGSLSLGGWLLFGILFLWQFPHFMAIAWMYREDYGRAGIRMLPVVDPAGTATFRQIIVTAALLVPMSLLPAVTGMAGAGYFFGAVVLGMALLQVCLWAARARTNVRAKWLMHATVAHIPLLLGLLILDRLAR
jgi:protoheme IX farnesyltransferase